MSQATQSASASVASGRSTTVAKVIGVLEALATNEHEISVRELARTTGFDKSAISRLFGQFEEMGIVERSRTNGFTVGPRLFALAGTIHARDALWKAAEPVLKALADEFNETCYLSTREGNQVVFRKKIDCDHTIRYVIPLGQTSPLHAGAGGRAILAGLREDELDAFLATEELARLTRNTITDPGELRERVRADRQQGYSASIGERVERGSAVAAPYFAPSGDCIGSIVFTCPAERFPRRRQREIATAVIGASRQLSIRLGHVHNGSTSTAGPPDDEPITR